jgi:hypothetical protein
MQRPRQSPPETNNKRDPTEKGYDEKEKRAWQQATAE